MTRHWGKSDGVAVVDAKGGVASRPYGLGSVNAGCWMPQVAVLRDLC
jgi:hypothetical protein